MLHIIKYNINYKKTGPKFKTTPVTTISWWPRDDARDITASGDVQPRDKGVGPHDPCVYITLTHRTFTVHRLMLWLHRIYIYISTLNYPETPLRFVTGRQRYRDFPLPTARRNAPVRLGPETRI